MVTDGEYVAVVDRIEEGEREPLAVLLLERDDRQVDELAVPAADLPAEVAQDAVLRVLVEADEVAEATYLPDETESRSRSAQSRFDRLASRPPEESDASARRDDEPTDAADPESAANSYPAVGRTDDSMVHAYLMVSTSAGSSESVLASVRNVDAVTDAHVVAGSWDLIIELDAETVTDVLHAVTTGIRNLDGVGTTRCYVCLD